MRALREPDAGVQSSRSASLLEGTPALVVPVIVQLERGPLVAERLDLGRELDGGQVAFLEAVLEAPGYPDPGKGVAGGRASNAATLELRFAIFARCWSRSPFWSTSATPFVST